LTKVKHPVEIQIQDVDMDADPRQNLTKKRSKRRKHCALAVVRRSQTISPHCRPLPGGAGRPEFNQLEMVTALPTTLFGDDRCTQFRVIVVTVPQTNKKHSHTTSLQDQLQYTAPQLVMTLSVVMANRLIKPHYTAR